MENNSFGGGFEKGMDDKGSNGMGLESVEITGAAYPGSGPTELVAKRQREVARYNELASKAFGNPEINNAGIVLDGFGGKFGESK